MSSKDLGSTAKRGVIWTALFQGASFFIKFGSGIILARILLPEDFGLVGMAFIAIQLARRLTSFGFSAIIVQRKTISDDHCQTVFLSALLLMGAASLILFFSAPAIADFFSEARLTPILRIICWDFVLKSFTSVPRSLLQRDMKFKELNFITTMGDASIVFTAVAMAVMGLGFWSLIYSKLIGSLVLVIMVFYYARWIPKFRFSKVAFKDSFSFGAWIYANGYLQFLINKTDYFMIGKFLGAAQLGYYERAFNLMSLPRKNIVRRVSNIFFSAYSRIQDQDDRLVNAFLKVVLYLSFITFPLMIWLYFAAPSLIPVIYGDKWIPTVRPLQIMCIAGISDTLVLIFHPLILAKNWVRFKVYRQIIYIITLVVGIFIGLKWGIVGVAWGVTAASIFHLLLMIQLTVTRLPMTVVDFLKTQKSIIVYGLVQIVALYGAQLGAGQWFDSKSVQMLLISSSVAFISFFIAHFIFRFKDISELLQDVFGQVIKFLGPVPVVGAVLKTLNKKL